MNCPKCGTAGAYVGFTSIECNNRDCEHYTRTVPIAPVSGVDLGGPDHTAVFRARLRRATMTPSAFYEEYMAHAIGGQRTREMMESARKRPQQRLTVGTELVWADGRPYGTITGVSEDSREPVACRCGLKPTITMHDTTRPGIDSRVYTWMCECKCGSAQRRDVEFSRRAMAATQDEKFRLQMGGRDDVVRQWNMMVRYCADNPSVMPIMTEEHVTIVNQRTHQHVYGSLCPIAEA